MKKVIIALLVLSFSTNLFAQDIIHMRRGKKVAAKVTEVGPQLVSFYKFNESTGMIYKLNIEYIDSIVYESGTVDKFNNMRRKPISPVSINRAYNNTKNRPTFDGGPNSFSSGIFLLDNTARAESKNDINNKAIIAVYSAYERMFANNKIGLSVMPFIGVNRKAYGTGIGITLYPRPYYQAVFHTGPQLFLYRSEIYRSYFNKEGGYSVSGIYPTTVLTFTYNLGVNVHVNKNWMMVSDLGIGHVITNTKRRELDKLRGYGDRHGYIFNDFMYSAKLGVAYRF